MTPFLVIGPGRCGTKSLFHILRQCRGVEVDFEAYPTLGGGGLDVGGMIELISKRGQVGVLWTWFARLMRLQHPEMPVVCLHRPCSEVVASFMAMHAKRRRPWQLGLGGPIPNLTPSVIASHWRDVVNEMNQVKSPVVHLNVDQINDDAHLDRMYDGLGIEVSDRAYPEKRRYNVREAVPVVQVKDDGSITWHSDGSDVHAP